MDPSLISSQRRRYNELWVESNALYAQWAERRGLSYTELLVISSLAEGPCRQKDICSQWFLPKQTVHTVLKHFSEQGLTELKASEGDRRNKDIFLTEKGSALASRVAGQLKAQETEVWRRLGAERSAALVELCSLYNQVFREVEANANVEVKANGIQNSP